MRPDVWSAELEEALVRIGHRFGRADLRRQMRAYVHGLLGPVGRKNSWQLAEYAGHRTPAGLQNLLNRARWSADEVRDDLQEYIAEKLGDPDGVLVLDDTGFLKKGTVSAGVQRQYSGTAGRTENCQIGVFAAYATRQGRALVDRELYLPKSWTSHRDRCEAAKIPDDRDFATKGDLAKAMIQRALASPLPIARVTADSACGQEWRLRRMLEEAGVGYVLAVPKSQPVPAPGRIDLLITQAPDEAWERHSCGAGAKGPRVYDWAAAKLPAIPDFDGDHPTHERWVLARRSLARPKEIAYYLAYAPVETEVPELARIAGSRWAIEECFQAAKNECGLDQYEVRRYPGWYRHITLAMLAHAVLSATSATATAARGAAETVPVNLRPSPWQKSGGSWQFTVPHRHTGGKADHALSWSWWRRRHQATAQRCHYRRRRGGGYELPTPDATAAE
ncbi:IS701 family transposase [Streptomyces sp. Tu 3180]|uniref:IS701 family transposase n=1 Tax=Streptomyces sp. Tu 3180 TaxID=2682611 RepID=UPI001FB6F5AC|nr:IS701 family transposase [Streptomyces sp. Tu 3180]